MWARTATGLLLAAALAGCAMSPQPSVGMSRRLPPRAMQRDVAAVDEAIALAANSEYEAAAARLQQALPRFEAAGDDRRAAESMFWLAFCREKQGQTYQARSLYKRVAEKYPRQAAAGKARQRLQALPAAVKPAPPRKAP